MRRNFGGSIVKRAVIAAMTIMLATGSPMVVLAEEVNVSADSEEGDSEQEKSAPSEDRNSKGENDGDAHEAAAEAAKAADEVAAKVDDIKTEIQNANSNADSADSTVTEAEDAAQNATEDTADAGEKESEIEIEASIDTYNDDTDKSQKTVDSVTEELETKASSLEKVIEGTGEEDTLINKLEQQKENALSALENTLEKEGEERKEAAAEAKKAAEEAQRLYDKAEKQKNDTSASLDNAIKEYNTKAIIYGEPLYGEKVVTYDIQNMEESITVNGMSAQDILAAKLAAQSILAEDELKEAYHSIQDLDLSQSEDAIKAAESNYTQAAQEYENARQNAEEAAQEAEKAAEEVMKEADNVATEDTVNAVFDENKDALSIGKENDKTTVEVVDIKELDSKEIINNAEETLNTAKENLAEIKKDATAYYNLKQSDLDKLKELLGKIVEAEQAVTDAEKVLEDAKKIVADAQRYRKYAESYADYVDGKAQSGTGYVRITKDAEGNTIRLEKQDDFDLKDDETISRPTTYFEMISGIKQIEVPEVVYQKYLKAIVKHERNAEEGIEDADGAGISDRESLPFIYWELENGESTGNITGKYFTSTTELEDGKAYFVAYAFKKEKDSDRVGYHFDGVVVNYKKETPPEEPEEPEKPEEPEEPEKPTPVVPGGSDDKEKKDSSSSKSSSSNNSSTTAISDEPTPLADIPPVTTLIDEEVPLAPTLQTIEDDAVPKTDSVLQTGDTSVPMLPFVLGGATAIGVAFLISAMKKKRD